jgi:hypothetical protein
MPGLKKLSTFNFLYSFEEPGAWLADLVNVNATEVEEKDAKVRTPFIGNTLRSGKTHRDSALPPALLRFSVDNSTDGSGGISVVRC